ncbi:glycosyltransferase [Myroides odoratus]
MKKVLHVINSLGYGGAEKLISDSLPLYIENNIVCDLFVLNYTSNELSNKLEKNGINIIKSKAPNIYSLKNIYYLRKVIKNYDIVHLHLFPAFYFGVIATLFSSNRIKVVYTEHNTHNRRREKKYFKILDKFIYSRIDFIGCISEAVHDKLVEYLPTVINSTNCAVINNGILLDSFVESERKKSYNFFEEHSFKLVQVSSFTKQKDQMTLISALAMLSNDIVLFLVGDGPLRKACEQKVIDLGLKDRVRFLGYRNDIPDLLNYSDVVVLSSHYEGFGLAIVEGMASSKPVVASDVEGLADIVRNYGLLFEKGDCEALSNWILRLKQDKIFYSEIAKKCFIRSKDYSIENMILKYVDVYQK